MRVTEMMRILTNPMPFSLGVLDIVVRTRTKVINYDCIPDRLPLTQLDKEADKQGREENTTGGAPKPCN
jgi:hypothetical protein